MIPPEQEYFIFVVSCFLVNLFSLKAVLVLAAENHVHRAAG